MTRPSRPPRIWLVSSEYVEWTLAVLRHRQRLGLELRFCSPLAGDVAIGLE